MNFLSTEKKEIIKRMINNKFKFSDLLSVLEDEIKTMVLEKELKTYVIKNILEKELDINNFSLDAIKKFIAKNKKKWINEQNKKGEKMKKKFILLTNDKGGVGKTTLATLLDLPNSLILNLDRTREIADIYPYKKIVDFGKVEEEEGINIEDFLAILNEDETFENIIIDTKGGIEKDLLTIIPYVDSIIVPTKVGTTSEKPSYEYIIQLKDIIEELGKKNINWGLVYNEISPKFLIKSGFGKYELSEEFKKTANLIKQEVLGNALKAVTFFKRSEAIVTREREAKDINELMKNNFGAYLVIKKEIERLNKDLTPVIKG